MTEIDKEETVTQNAYRRVKHQTNKFRVHARKLLLTYSNVPEDLTLMSVIKQLQTNINMKQYVISKERHASGAPHYHVILILHKKLDIRSTTRFHIVYNEQSYSCNIQSVRSLTHAVSYVCKDQDYCTNINEIHNGVLVDIEELLIERARAYGVDLTLQDYVKDQPKKALGGKNLVSLRKTLNTVLEVDEGVAQLKPKTKEISFSLDDFVLTEELTQWLKDDHQPTLFLIGKAGIGKTVFAKLIAETLEVPYIVVNQLQGLKNLTKKHKCAVYDDFSSQDMNPDLWLSLIKTDIPQDIRVLRDIVTKEAGMIQIFTFNEDSFLKIAYLLRKPQFSRRVRLVFIEGEFLKQSAITQNITINIQNNNYYNQNGHNHLYNNTEAIKNNYKTIEKIEKSASQALQ